MTCVSIIIPVFNVEKYLEKCLDSVCNQTLKDIEIICINDCSSDNSLEILKKYAQKDERIKIINFEENKGAAVARNQGLDEAQGEYIGFVDSDDFIDLDFYERLYMNAQKNVAEVVLGNGKVITGNVIENQEFFFADVKKNKINFTRWFSVAIYQKKMLENYNIRFIEKCNYAEDELLPIKSAVYSNKLILVKDVSYYYRQDNELSLSSNLENSFKKQKDYQFALNKIYEFLNSVQISSDDYNIAVSRLIDETLKMFSYTKTKNKKDFVNFIIYLYDNFKYKNFFKIEPHKTVISLLNTNNIDGLSTCIKIIENKKMVTKLREHILNKDKNEKNFNNNNML